MSALTYSYTVSFVPKMSRLPEYNQIPSRRIKTNNSHDHLDVMAYTKYRLLHRPQLSIYFFLVLSIDLYSIRVHFIICSTKEFMADTVHKIKKIYKLKYKPSKIIFLTGVKTVLIFKNYTILNTFPFLFCTIIICFILQKCYFL